MDFFQTYRAVFLGIHLMGVVIGFGAAITADMLFFRFLKDFKISSFESSVLKYVSQATWIGIIILLFSGMALFLASPSALMASAKFQAKITIFLLLILNGTYLYVFIHPTLTKIPFGKSRRISDQISWYRKRAFVSGAISLPSWFSIFILALMPRSQPFSFLTLLAFYFLIFVVAIIGSLGMERFLKTKAAPVKSKR